MRRRFVVLGALALLTACRPKSEQGLRIDPELARLVPADTVFILGAQIEQIRNTPVYQKYGSLLNFSNLNQFTEQTGVDPRKDLSQLVSASNGKTGVLLARGKFNLNDLKPRLEAKGAKRTGYKGVDLFGNERTAAAFLSSTTALAGSTPVLKEIIDARGNSRGVPPALGVLIKSIPADAQIWAALAGGLPALNLTVPQDSNLGNAMRLLQGIDTATAGIGLENGLDLKADATCRTDANAKRLHDALRGLIGLGRLSTPDNEPDLLKLYDAIQVNQQQNRVDVAAKIPAELTDRFIDLWIKRR